MRINLCLGSKRKRKTWKYMQWLGLFERDCSVLKCYLPLSAELNSQRILTYKCSTSQNSQLKGEEQDSTIQLKKECTKFVILGGPERPSPNLSPFQSADIRLWITLVVFLPNFWRMHIMKSREKEFEIWQFHSKKFNKLRFGRDNQVKTIDS